MTKSSGTVNLNQTRTASPANEISGISASVGATWATPAYDLAGNMTSIPKPTALTSAFTTTYDGWNRLVSVTDGSNTVATYQYDGLNRRTVKSIYVSSSLDHNEHAYFNEQWQLLEVRKEVSGTINSNPLEQYVWHPFYIDAAVMRDYDATTSGSPTRYYYASDANHDVTAVTGSTGAVIERYYYSAYGTLIFLDSGFNVPSGGTTQIGNSVTYTGRPTDLENGLSYYRHRFYHPALGVFTARDALDYDAGDSNLYNYVTNRPIAFSDPLGLQRVDPCPECSTPWKAPPILGKQWQYGCYCGKEPAPPRKTIPPPIDPTDIACKNHDTCCATATTPKKAAACNAKLCKEATEAAANGCALKRCDVACCRKAALEIQSLFCNAGAKFCAP